MYMYNVMYIIAAWGWSCVCVCACVCVCVCVCVWVCVCVCVEREHACTYVLQRGVERRDCVWVYVYNWQDMAR